jgi:transketolase
LNMDLQQLTTLSQIIRSSIVRSTTGAGSGHLTSSLSAVELITGLCFGGIFRYRVDDPNYPNNDRLIFSKGHAAPLLYALWGAAGKVTDEELLTLRQFDSVLEGHPTKRFAYTEAATGSLGQGLSVGVGMAINAKYLDNLAYRTYVLLGDSEMAEGQNWEAMQLATYYKLDNLVGIVDVNRLGQRGETMLSWDFRAYARRAEAFGWNAVMLEDGHHMASVLKAYEIAAQTKGKPTLVIAKTIKGKGITFLENKEEWHGKVLTQQQLDDALREFGDIDTDIRGTISKPDVVEISNAEFLMPNKDINEPMTNRNAEKKEVELDSPQDYERPLAVRKAYGHALVEMAEQYPEMVVLDAEVSNSTFAETFKKAYPKRFFEMFIAEQNMVSVAVGLAARGKKPFVSTFASFFTRAVDQIRVAQYNQSGVNFVGSHVGVSIGQDGPTQMGLEDIAIFRAILDSVVLSPADHVATEKLVKQMILHPGICYMRATRMEVEPLYEPDEEFVIGGSKTLRTSEHDRVTLIGAGVTIYECLKAYEELKKQGVMSRVIDLYSIKPVDVGTLVKACKETNTLIVVEDHFAEGGMAEAVRSALVYETTPVHSLAVRKMPRSGTPEELLRYEGIDAEGIVGKVNDVVG